MNYTEPAKEVLKKAEKIARELDHPYVGTEHLLLAFMRVCTGVAGQILSANGVEEANLYKIVDELISPVGEVTFQEKPKRSPRLEYTLEESKEEAQKTTVSQSNAREKKKRPAWKEVLSWCMTLLAAFVLALVLKNYVIINATVPTGSMENTIEPGDDLFGFRLAYKFSEPERGDIVIFKFPDDESQKYVKRVIGLPGEKVTITEGKIYINNSDVPLEEDYLKEDWVRATGPFSFEVPEDSYLVLGDNRNDSYDARYWENTYVTKDEIIGKAYFTYYPFSRFGSLYQ